MTTTTTSGAADLRTAAQAVVDRWDTPLWKDVPATAEYIGRLRAALAAGQATAAQAVVPAGWKLVPEQPTLPMLIKGSDTDTSTSAEDCRRVYRAMLAAAPAQPAAQQVVAYAALPTHSHAGRVYEEGFLIGTCPLYTADKMRAFADATHTLRASHGQAPASKIDGLTAAQESLGVEFERVLHDNLFDLYEESPHTARLESARADSVQEDAARLDFLIEQRAYVVSDPDACPGHWLHWARPDGRTWVQGDEHPTPRAAIDAARKQGARWQSAVRALTLHI